jgi:hypothetical protein
MSELLQTFNYFFGKDTISASDPFLPGKLGAKLQSVIGEITGVNLTQLNTKISQPRVVQVQQRQIDEPTKRRKHSTPHRLQDEDEDVGAEENWTWTGRSSTGQFVRGIADTQRIALDWVEVEATIGDTGLKLGARYTEDQNGLQVLMMITGTSADHFYEQLMKDAYNPELERLALREPVLVTTTKTTQVTWKGFQFPCGTGLSIIAEATPGANMKALDPDGQTIYLWGQLLGADNEFVERPILRTYPTFSLKLGASLILKDSFYEVSIHDAGNPNLEVQPEERDDEREEQEEGEEGGHVAYLAVCGRLEVQGGAWRVWGNVPKDDGTLGLRLMGYGIDPPFESLAPLSPLLGGKDDWIKFLDLPLGSIGLVPSTWGFRLRGLYYFYELTSKVITTSAINLLVLRDVKLTYAKASLQLSDMRLHCTVGFPDSHRPVSAWAAGSLKIADVTLRMDIRWLPSFCITAAGAQIPQELPAQLSIQLPPLNVTINEYVVRFPTEGPATLTLIAGSESAVFAAGNS